MRPNQQPAEPVTKPEGEFLMKLTKSVNAFTKRMWAFATFAALVAATMATPPAHAQVGQGQADGMVGSWRVTVNVTDPQGVPSFPVLMTFHADGTLLQTRPLYIPSFGVMETTHFGAWKRLNDTQIAATTFSLAQGAPGNNALNGAFFGTEQVNFQPVIAPDGNSFTAQWTSTVFDPNGNPIIKGSGNLSGVRIQVEQ
jgi:hypothetical protein